MESNHHGCFHPQGPQAEQRPRGRAENGPQSQVSSDCGRLNPDISGAGWRTTGASGELGWQAGRPATIRIVTTREKAHAVLDHLPEDRVGAALAALEAVKGRDTSLEAVLARHCEERISPEEFDRDFGSLPTDDEG